MLSSSDAKEQPKKISKAPPSRTCYVCGRMYGVNSYEIHIKQCKQLWQAREALKPLNERKPLPPDPFSNPVGSANGNNSSNITNNNNNKNGNCNSNSGFGGAGGGGDNGVDLSVEEMNRLASEAFNNGALERCKFCDRTFLAEKLLIHNRSCTADKPARAVRSPVNRRPLTTGTGRSSIDMGVNNPNANRSSSPDIQDADRDKRDMPVSRSRRSRRMDKVEDDVGDVDGVGEDVNKMKARDRDGEKSRLANKSNTRSNGSNGDNYGEYSSEYVNEVVQKRAGSSRGSRRSVADKAGSALANDLPEGNPNANPKPGLRLINDDAGVGVTGVFRGQRETVLAALERLQALEDLQQQVTEEFGASSQQKKATEKSKLTRLVSFQDIAHAKSAGGKRKTESNSSSSSLSPLL